MVKVGKKTSAKNVIFATKITTKNRSPKSLYSIVYHPLSMFQRLLQKKIALSFFGGFIAIFLLWLLCLPKNLFENATYSTVVYDRNGELLGARVAADGQWRFPPCDSLPEKFVKALIEFEDKDFYRHCGVSVKALGRATVQNIRNGRVVSGGSTISMQVARLSWQKPRTFWQKLVEIFVATRLEWRYSKEEILLLYASHAPFGGNVVGIDAALWRYLGDKNTELSWAEATTLALLPNAPSNIHLAKNREQLLAKRNRLLARLHQKGDISDEDFALAVEEPLMDFPYQMPQFAPHLVDFYDKKSRGNRCQTHIDLTLQQRVEESLSQWSKELRLQGINDLSAVIVEVKTGEIVAYCGNADLSFNRDGKWVDIARSPRSSGSILKPLLYAAALQNGTILPHTLLPDIPMDFGGFSPKNFNFSYAGAIEADKALALSLNIPNVQLLRDFGVENFAETLKNCGFSTLSRPANAYGLSLVLGGAEVSLLDVVTCYAKMAAVYLDSTQFPKFKLRDEMALFYTFEAMREVNRPDQMDWKRVSSVQNVAWKTGTSFGARDAWAVGVTPEFAVGVWAGNADGNGVSALTGARTAGPILFDLFALLPSCNWFTKPNETQGVEVTVCAHSGHLAGRNCAKTVKIWAPKACKNSKNCPFCREIYVSLDGKKRITDHSEPTRNERFFVLPPAMEHFYKPLHPEYATLPPLKPCSAASQTASMTFIYPTNGSNITLPRQLDGSQGSFVCKIAHKNPSVELFWHLDSHFLGSTTDLHQMQISPTNGTHKITVIDTFGEEIFVKFAVSPPIP